jgi:class 3 adenylate cyclase
MSAEQAARTCLRSVLIADIVSSTALYEALGNLAARQRVAGCLEALSRTVAGHAGSVVKSLGDGILATFPLQGRAVHAAVEICERAEESELEVRVGVHCGEVIEEAGDVFGDAVNTAARLAALAKPSEILITASLRDSLPASMRAFIHRVPPLSIKGKKEPVELFAILRSDSRAADNVSQTVELGRTQLGRIPSLESTRLELRYVDVNVRVAPGIELSLGRDPQNGLVVAHPHASRLHAKVFHRQGKFIIEDLSANGTYVLTRPRFKLRLLREQAFLVGSGEIYLGADPESVASEPVRYEAL